MRRLLFKIIFVSTLLFSFTISTSSNKPSISYNGESVQQGMGPTSLAITKDGEYIYVGFHLSDDILKVRTEDLSVIASADLSEYFPIQCYDIALDSSEKKLFVQSQSWQKLLVLDTQTMSVVHSIDNIGATSITQSNFGPFIIALCGNTVKFVNTETYEVSEFTDESVVFLNIQERMNNQDEWYVATQTPEWSIIGIYNYKSNVWTDTIMIPCEPNWMTDLKVLPNKQKLYVGIVSDIDEYFNVSGWLYSIDLVEWKAKILPIDGGVMSLENSPDNKFVYVGTNYPAIRNNNILMIDAQSDTIIGPINRGYLLENRDLQIDHTKPNLLYATSNDANALIKIDLNDLRRVKRKTFNRESIKPHFFVRRPMQSTGYILIHGSRYAFELDLNKVIIKDIVEFPLIRDDIWVYDAAINSIGNLYIAQGESIIEVDGGNMNLIRDNRINPDITAVWRFTLSNDETMIYTISQDRNVQDYQPNIFMAINTANFNVVAHFNLEGGAFNERPYELTDGSKLYALGGHHNGNIVVHVIETEGYTLKKTITFDEPEFPGISAGPYYPFAYDSSSHTLFVGATSVVLAIDTNTDIIEKVIYLDDLRKIMGILQFVYVNPYCLIHNPNENYLYMVHLDRSFVSIYDLNNDMFLPYVIPLKGYFPNFAFTNNDYSKIYSINTRSDNISVIDVNSKTEEKVIDFHDYLNTSIHEKIEIPLEFDLIQNYPNPFNPETTIKYELPKVSEVTISIYNILGQRIKTLVDEEKQPGYYSVKWNGINDGGMRVSSGIYLYQIKAGDFVRAKKMVFLK